MDEILNETDLCTENKSVRIQWLCCAYLYLTGVHICKFVVITCFPL